MSANPSTFQPSISVVSTSSYSDNNNNNNNYSLINIFVSSSTSDNCSTESNESFAMNDLSNGHRMKIDDSQSNQPIGNGIVDNCIDNNIVPTENGHRNGDIESMSTSFNACFETNHDNGVDPVKKLLPNNINLTANNERTANGTCETVIDELSEVNLNNKQTNGVTINSNGESTVNNLMMMNGHANVCTENNSHTVLNSESTKSSDLSDEELNNTVESAEIDKVTTNESNHTNSTSLKSNGIPPSTQFSHTNGEDSVLADQNNSTLNNLDYEPTPFPFLAGEELLFKEKINEGCIYLTNYRLYLKPLSRCGDDVLKNYHQQQQEQLINLPIGAIDSVEIRDLYYLVVFTKYVQSFVLTFSTSELASLWHKRLSDVHNIKIEDLFCFQYFDNLAARDLKLNDCSRNVDLISLNKNEIKLHQDPYQIVCCEFQRMKFDAKSWKISELNKDYKFSNSYPQYFILPKDMTDKDLEHVANFRYSRRIPVVVWRSKRNGCVIVRSSQPVVGWFGWRSGQDERLLEKILKICNRDTQESYRINKNDYGSKQINNDVVVNSQSNTSSCALSNNAANSNTIIVTDSGGTCANGHTPVNPVCNNSNNGDNNCQSPISDDTTSYDNKANLDNHHSTSNGLTTANHNNVSDSQSNHSLEKLDESGNDGATNNKLLILDARSYAAAFANRAMGGGSECAEYYLNCDVQFMGLNNIHSIRKSFNALRYICESVQIDQANWFTLLDNTKWFHNLVSLLKAAVVIVDAISVQERPVLVHCSDGWDRTPQMIALAELMLDPYYRTIDGFKVLIEREWLQFGHKFADRCRSSTLNIDLNERCPVFLQWLDCVHQLLKQFPCEFEFNVYFLIKLVYHTYSCLFGTFTCNNVQERTSLQVYERTISVWAYFELEKNNFYNYLYIPKQEVLRPSCRVKDICFWSDVYVPVSNTSSMTNFIPYSDICNQQVNNNNNSSNNISVDQNNDLDSMLNEDNAVENGILFDCNHEVKCQSLSRCDLTRSASLENLSKIKNISPNEHINANFSSIDGDCSRLRIRHLNLSDPFLYEASDMCNDRDNFCPSNQCSIESACDIENSNGDDTLDNVTEDNMHEFANNDSESTVYQAQMNGLLNGRANGCVKMGLQDLAKLYENGIDCTKESCQPVNINSLIPCSPLQQQQQSTNSAELFDIDGQIIVKDKSYIQLQQLFDHQKRMINRLSYQLKLTRNAYFNLNRSNKSCLPEDSNVGRKHSTRNSDNLRILSKHLEALDLNGCDNNHYNNNNSSNYNSSNNNNSSNCSQIVNRRLTVSNGDSPMAANRFSNLTFLPKKTPKDCVRLSSNGRRPRSTAECRPFYNE